MELAGRVVQRRLALLAGLLLPVVAGAALVLQRDEAALRSRPLPAAEAAVPAGLGLDGETVRLQSGGRARSLLVQSPLAGGASRGVVVVLGPHGLTTARTAADLRFDELRSRGYAVAYPSTVDGDWNAGRCCGATQRAGVDDVGFLLEVRRLLTQRFAVADRAVGLVGYSTGGQMAYRLLCEHPAYASAALVVGGSLEAPCVPASPLPATLIVHGMEDSTVPWQTTTRPTRMIDYSPTPFHTTVAEFARAAGCTQRTRDTSDGRELIAWHDCSRIPSLTSVGMPGTGHGWKPLQGSVYATRFLPAHLPH